MEGVGGPLGASGRGGIFWRGSSSRTAMVSVSTVARWSTRYSVLKCIAHCLRASSHSSSVAWAFSYLGIRQEVVMILSAAGAS